MEMDRLPEAKIAELKARHKDLSEMAFSFTGDDEKEVSGALYCRKPQKPHIDKLMKDVAAKPGKAMMNLVLSVLVHPAPDVFRALCEKYPGLSATIGGELTEDLGFGADVIRKKL